MIKRLVWSLMALSILVMLSGCAVYVDPPYGSVHYRSRGYYYPHRHYYHPRYYHSHHYYQYR